MTTRLTLGLALALVATALSTSGCGESSEAGQTPSRPADVSGMVTKVDRPGDGRPAIVIDRGEACALVIYIDGDTDLVRRAGDGSMPVSVDDLALGQAVDAWVGAIAESCPEQTTADAIAVLESAA